MSSDADNLVLQHLRAIRADIGELKEDAKQIKQRITSLEGMVAHIYADMVEQHARFDRLSDRIGRIERRLQLSDEVNG